MKVLIVGTGGQIEGKLLGWITGAARDFRPWIAKLKTALGRWLPEWQDNA